MARAFYVGEWHVESDLNRISSASRSTHIEPKAMDVLVFLAERAGEMVTRSQILDQVWAGTSVSDEVLTHSISLLRKVFVDDARHPHVIETISRKGYRLVAPVRYTQGGAASQAGPRRSINLGLVAVAGIVVLFALGYGLRWVLSPPSGEPRLSSLAVLPLKNLSGSPSEEYFSEGLTEAFITSLGSLGDIRVISFQSILRYKGTARPARDIARELRVDGIVTGGVLRSGGRVRITVQLVDAATDRILWSDEQERVEEDLISLQHDVVTRVAEGIHMKIRPPTTPQAAGPVRVNSEALQEYLRGRFLLARWEIGSYGSAADHFRRALAIEPDFAPGWAGLADCLVHMAGMEGAPSRFLPEARSAALRALKLDETSAEAHASWGHLLYLIEWDWASAEREFLRALELNPNNLYAHLHYNPLLLALGRNDEGIAQARAAAALDPTTPTTLLQLSWSLRVVGRYDEAMTQVKEASELDPETWRVPYYRAQIHSAIGRFDAAFSDLTGALERSPDNPLILSTLAKANARGGRRDEALELLAKLQALGTQRYVDPELAARVYSSLGMKDSAIACLEQALEQHSVSLYLLNVSPDYAGMRSDPRFQRILNRLSFPKMSGTPE